jgi:hypothetical protein
MYKVLNMSCAVRITEFVVFCIPFIKILVVLGILGAATIYLLRARSMRRWLRVCMRVGGGILITTTGSLHVAADGNGGLHLKAPGPGVA